MKEVYLMKFRNLPFIISAIVMAAHFLRSNSFILVLLCLGAPWLLFIQKRWVVMALRLLSILFAVVWMAALNAIIQERVLEGRSWLASGIILGVVALFTLFSGWLLKVPQPAVNNAAG